MANERMNIYCVIPTERDVNFSQTGIEGDGELYTISYQDIAAVVSNTTMPICDPTRKNMSAHFRVVEALMEDYTVLPARFGLIADSEDKLRELLARYYSTLKDCILRVDNRIEVGVKVFWKKEKMLAIFLSRSPSLARLQRAIEQVTPAKAQALLVQAGELIKAQAEEWQAKNADEIYMSLVRVAVDGRHNYPIDISNVLNASFLVEKARQDKFDAAVGELDAKHGDWANIKYVKPVPPYDFVNLEMYLH